MSPVGQLLLRNLSGIRPESKLLWINPSADQAWHAVAGHAPKLSLFSQDYPSWIWLEAAGAKAEFGAFPVAASGTPDHLILTLPRSKQKLEMMLNCGRSLLPKNGSLWLAGENRTGIKSSPKYLEQWFGRVQKLDSARHCSLYEALEPLTQSPFSATDYQCEWRLEHDDFNLNIHSWPGVFAHGKLDDGTRLLLDQLSALRIKGRVLDFGCGSGVIAACLGVLCPEIDITMIDSDALALRSATQTIKANQIDAQIFPSSGLNKLQQRFDLIVTNPPFHHDDRTDVTLSMQLLQPVRNFLNPHGQLLMVVNRHIPYRKWLDRVFGRHEVLASNLKFQVLHAVQSH